MYELASHITNYYTNKAIHYFLDIPYNIWPWIFFISLPLFIFSVKPDSKASWRFWRIVLAIGIGYILINLSLHTHRAIQWNAYEQCRSESKNRIDSIEMHEECKHHINIADGASNVFFLFLGWIPAAAYLGFWELIWRVKYRHFIREMKGNFKGKWFSTLLIVCSVPVWLYILLVIIVFGLDI